jgi:hypothetical protein
MAAERQGNKLVSCMECNPSTLTVKKNLETFTGLITKL